MSKMDELRAMREARYQQAAARGAQAAPTRPVLPVLPPVDLSATDAGETRCGHRAISGRTCTREAGHSAKSHRYA